MQIVSIENMCKLPEPKYNFSVRCYVSIFIAQIFATICLYVFFTGLLFHASHSRRYGSPPAPSCLAANGLLAAACRRRRPQSDGHHHGLGLRLAKRDCSHASPRRSYRRSGLLDLYRSRQPSRFSDTTGQLGAVPHHPALPAAAGHAGTARLRRTTTATTRLRPAHTALSHSHN